MVDEDALVHGVPLLGVVRHVAEGRERLEHVADGAHLVVVELGLGEAPQDRHELEHLAVHAARVGRDQDLQGEAGC